MNLNELAELLETLEAGDANISLSDESKAVISLDSGDVTLNSAQCEKIFASTEAVDKLCDMLGQPCGDVRIDLYELNVSPDVFDHLESKFDHVEVF